MYFGANSANITFIIKYLGANITFIIKYRMATIVSDPTITQMESLWQTVRTVRRRQGSAGEL
ncbi:hypothetical protein LTSEADE_3965 [Salmonella enterica subsp. enterica serovar Adelaide str. A4-669]|uniref:Uncharacterized protein n=1 Tax=Salmonella enterica subsp. enterica serovar Adelaide str. A4-669 TaxID=913063 RepID=A0A6C8GJA0_SALET|nr:hypothetical protein LTSEADE_3965 [Salmonella enterica subsp. enterica serovar Adelaide str. A4-669]